MLFPCLSLLSDQPTGDSSSHDLKKETLAQVQSAHGANKQLPPKAPSAGYSPMVALSSP